jgi:uncharacterized membrane protein
MARNWSDKQIETTVGNLLRTGVAISALVVLIGAVVYLIHHGSSPASYHVYRGEPIDLKTLSGILHDVRMMQGRGIIQLGLLLLIATPVARVAFAIWGFAAEHDRQYTIFTMIVLIILLYSLLGAGSAF